MKRVNRKEHERFERLWDRLGEEFADPARQSTKVWRGDVRAIKWAAWWIRETIDDAKAKAEAHAVVRRG